MRSSRDMLADRQTDKQTYALITILRSVAGGAVLTTASISEAGDDACVSRHAAEPRPPVHPSVCLQWPSYRAGQKS